MDEALTVVLYQDFMITTFQAEGVWWARARVVEKTVGGDRPVTGGPWKSQAAARAAAEAFCNQGLAGRPTPDAGPSGETV